MTVVSKRVTRSVVPIHSARAIPCSAFLPSWSRQDDKLFESAMAACDRDARDQWEKVAAMLLGKHPSEIGICFANLAEDVKAIEAGKVVMLDYDLSKPGASEGGVYDLKEGNVVLEQAMGRDMEKAGNEVAGKAMPEEQEYIYAKNS
ncbi:hypothetical protein O6H91_09G080500 [Diphasiastrum complanatum]|uniref:Uncharacterized protein n=1 Tax=Diphasiastrum complanatum TaxID=34168 RepID=A0ACC2CRK1_DIPCM|nr:hypothetical protein O6H91_09G080500 [Diphasiastrum complanatum]